MSTDGDGLEELLGLVAPQVAEDAEKMAKNKRKELAVPDLTPAQKRQKKETDKNAGITATIASDIDVTIAATTTVLAKGIDSFVARLLSIPTDKLAKSLLAMRADMRTEFESRGVVYDE